MQDCCFMPNEYSVVFLQFKYGGIVVSGFGARQPKPPTTRKCILLRSSGAHALFQWIEYTPSTVANFAQNCQKNNNEGK